MLRIAQEALLNAVKHSKAGSIEVSIQGNNRQLSLTITDDGVGFTHPGAMGPWVEGAEGSSGHYGIIGMRRGAQPGRGRVFAGKLPGPRHDGVVVTAAASNGPRYHRDARPLTPSESAKSSPQPIQPPFLFRQRVPVMALLETKRTIRVLCVDDHPLVRKGIASIISNEPDMQWIGEAGNGREAVELFRRYRPDVTLMDLRMPGVDGIAATKMIREEFPDAKIIALTSFDGDQDIYRAWRPACADICSRRWCIPTCSTRFGWRSTIVACLPPEVSERLDRYFPEIGADAARSGSLEAGGAGPGQQRDRSAVWAQPAER